MRNTLALSTLFSAFLMLISTPNARAQGQSNRARYEFGGGVIGSFYDKKSFTSTSGTVDAGFEMGYGASVWLGHDMYPKISGEIRYDYLRNNMKLEGSGTKVTFGGESHAVHYDLHFHFADTSASVRPYILAGGGVKIYSGTGAERAYQPLSQVAVLTHTSELEPLVTVGVGVKLKLSDRAVLRLEFRDNMTPFPKKVIAPNRGTGGDGWLNNFAPTVGVGVLF